MTAIDPRFTAALPTTAEVPGTFTPFAFDPQAKFLRDQPFLEQAIKEVEGLLAVNEERRAAPGGDGATLDAERTELEARLAHARTALAEARTKAEADAKRLPPPPEFAIRIPTSVEREQINSRLIQLGLTSVSQEQIRASLIEALFEVDWKAEGVEDSESHAEDLAAFLDGLWQREEIQGAAFQHWRDQETERVLDAMHGAPLAPPAPQPVRIISVRDEAKARLLIDRLMETERMRKVVARQLDFSRRNAIIIVRINLLGVDSPVLSPVKPEPVLNALSEEAVVKLRQEIDDAYGVHLGTSGWNELVSHIDQLYKLDEFEVGNSASPPEKQPDPTGSSDRSGDIETSGGSSMASSIEPALAAESATITDNSSASISADAEVRSSASQTVEA